MNGTPRTRWIHQTGHVIAVNRSRVLLSVLAACELLMAVGARPVLTLVVGVVGGCALAAAAWVPRRPRTGLVLLLIGAVPFAVLTWWSLVTPLLAILAVGLGIAVIRGSSRVPRAT